MGAITQSSLADTCIIVVGASRGIGLAIATELARRGADVLAIGRSPDPDVAAPAVSYASVDAADTDALADATTRWLDGRRLNGVCLALGISLSPSEGLGENERFRHTIEANLVLPFNAALALQPLLARDASVVLITSINAVQGFPGNPGYVASKTALSGMARALAIDWGASGTRVNSLALGYFPTAMTNQSYRNEEERDRRSARTALGRWGRLEEAASAAAFLLGPDSTYVTGQTLVVDGGWTAKGL